MDIRSVAVLWRPVMNAQAVDRVELIPIQTASPTTRQFLTGDKNAKPTVIAGELRIPKPEPEKNAAIVLVHGSAGISARQDRWVQELNESRSSVSPKAPSPRFTQPSSVFAKCMHPLTPCSLLISASTHRATQNIEAMTRSRKCQSGFFMEQLTTGFRSSRAAPTWNVSRRAALMSR